MTITGKWVKDQAGDLVMKWTGDEIPVMKPGTRKLAEGIHVRLTTNGAPPAWPPARCSGTARTQVTKKVAELAWAEGR
jgi:hypothetical protein